MCPTSVHAAPGALAPPAPPPHAHGRLRRTSRMGCRPLIARGPHLGMHGGWHPWVPRRARLSGRSRRWWLVICEVSASMTLPSMCGVSVLFGNQRKGTSDGSRETEIPVWVCERDPGGENCRRRLSSSGQTESLRHPVQRESRAVDTVNFQRSGRWKSQALISTCRSGGWGGPAATPPGPAAPPPLSSGAHRLARA